MSENESYLASLKASMLDDAIDAGLRIIVRTNDREFRQRPLNFRNCAATHLRRNIHPNVEAKLIIANGNAITYLNMHRIVKIAAKIRFLSKACVNSREDRQRPCVFAAPACVEMNRFQLWDRGAPSERQDQERW